MVRFLAWHINNRKFCKGGSYRVKITDEIDKFKQKNPDEKPIILFDFLACLTIFLEDDVEVLCGGRLTECTRKAKLLCETLKKRGCELIFYMDGPIKETKIPQWFQRVNDKYEKHKLVFDMIKKGTPLKDIKSNHILTSYNNNLLRVFKTYGKINVSLANECDIELAEYATKNHPVGVFTYDTDFLITKGDWPIWSTKDFNFQDFSTIAWNKKALRKSLNLEKNQMPLFATLAGNDYLLYEVVEPFLHKLSQNKGGFTKLTEYIRTNFPSGYVTGEKLNELIKEIYSYHKNNSNPIIDNEENLKRSFLNSMNYYNFKKLRDIEVKPEWLKKHVDDTTSTFVYIFMRNLSFIIRQNYIDLSKSDVRPFSELCLLITQRLMGIILYGKYKVNNLEVKREVYLKPSHDEPFEKQLVEPIYPPSIIVLPHLVDLLGYGRREIRDEVKFNVLSWVVSAGRKKLTTDNLKEICDSVYFRPALILNYLVKSMQITHEEADVILLAIQEGSTATDEKMTNTQPPVAVDERAFWLSFVFTQITYYFIQALIICGLYKYVNQDYYDGYVFHKMFSKYFSMDVEKRKVLIEPIQKYRLYAK